MVLGSTTISKNQVTNKGGGIHSVSSSIIIRLAYKFVKNKPLNYLYFTANIAKLGGGLCLEVSSKFYIVMDNSKQKVLQFTDNSAEKGGAIFVADNTNSGTCISSQNATVSASESECFFQPLKVTPDSRPVILEQHVSFSYNTATISGVNVFGGLLDRCTVNNKKYSDQPDFINYTSNDTTSDAVRVCLCYNDEVNCSYQLGPIRVRKGEKFNISAVAVDQMNHTLNATIHGYVINAHSSLGTGQKDQLAYSSCTNLTFQIHSPDKKEELILFASGPCKALGISKSYIEINFLPCTCLLGFQSSNAKGNNNSCECDCDPQLHPFVSHCDVPSGLIHRNRNVWITAVDNFTHILIYPHCPFDYCFPPIQPVSINLSRSDGADAQCAFSRSGKLCGTCQPGLSLSLGSSHCVLCPSYWPALSIAITIGAILAGIVMVAFIMMFELTVAVGTLNGLIFFVNIVDANKSILLPFHKTNIFTVFISWLNLDVGFDTCFIKGMDTYTKSWLGFIFPSYLVLLVVLVIIISNHSTRFAHIIGKNNPVATLATLILLSYAKLLQNIIMVVSFAVIKYPNGTHELVWRPDATVQYLQGKHIPLFLAAVVILILGIIYTFILFSWQWINQLPEKRIFKWIWNTKLISFMDAYHAPYRPKYRCWTGILLFSRVILYIISFVNVSGDPSLNLLGLQVVVAFLWLLKGNNAYRKWPTDILESGFYLNMLTFCAAKFYVLQFEGCHISLTYFSISASIIMFICIMCYHTVTKCTCIPLTWLKDKVTNTPQPQHDGDVHAHLLDNHVWSPADESSS